MKLHAFLMIAWLGIAAPLAAVNVAAGPNLEISKTTETATQVAFAGDRTGMPPLAVSATSAPTRVMSSRSSRMRAPAPGDAHRGHCKRRLGRVWTAGGRAAGLSPA